MELCHPSASSPKNVRSMFCRGFGERHDLEQYFWTESTVKRLMNSLNDFYEECCCLTTPSLAHGWHLEGREEWLLDIDRRFEYLPKFRYFNLITPENIEEDFQIIIFDPPFFYISMEQMYKAVCKIVKDNFKTKILIGFLKREERELMRYFGIFGIKPTNFLLEYAQVKPNKWKNYCLYSNVDLPGIKRAKKCNIY
uniref:N6-adenine methyltransferase n=1 Tax=Panagrolaimus superbus TaxID=310955 RepID=A0A914Z4Z5_9BILA